MLHNIRISSEQAALIAQAVGVYKELIRATPALAQHHASGIEELESLSAMFGDLPSFGNDDTINDFTHWYPR
jgi:hypothetical protein